MNATPERRRAPGKAPLKVQIQNTTEANPTLLAEKINVEPVDWEVKIGESAEVAPPLDSDHRFFSITKADMLIVVEPSDEHAGYYVITTCRITRDDEGDICGVEPEADELRPLKGHAVGFFLEQFGCSRSDTWLRAPRVAEAA